jgi:hypothetical protein
MALRASFRKKGTRIFFIKVQPERFESVSLLNRGDMSRILDGCARTSPKGIERTEKLQKYLEKARIGLL